MNTTTRDLAVGVKQPPVLHFLPDGSVRHDFMAWLLPGILEQKMLNLLMDQDADVEKRSDKCFVLHIGQKKVIRRRYAGDTVPLKVTLTLCSETRCPRGMMHVEAVISPQGIVDREALRLRCNQLVTDMHACFLGHRLERV